jgi:hypothetical protein
MAFLPVWDKDSCAGSFLVLFPCIYIYITTPVGSSHLVLFPLAMVSLACLRFQSQFKGKKSKWLKDTWKNIHHSWP